VEGRGWMMIMMIVISDPNHLVILTDHIEEFIESCRKTFSKSCYSLVGCGTKSTALWARDWGQKEGAVWLRFKEEALREFGHPKSNPLNSLLVNVSPG